MTSLTAIRKVQPLQGCNGGFVRGPGVRCATPGYVVRLLRSLPNLCFARGRAAISSLAPFTSAYLRRTLIMESIAS